MVPLGLLQGSCIPRFLDSWIPESMNESGLGEAKGALGDTGRWMPPLLKVFRKGSLKAFRRDARLVSKGSCQAARTRWQESVNNQPHTPGAYPWRMPYWPLPLPPLMAWFADACFFADTCNSGIQAASKPETLNSWTPVARTFLEDSFRRAPAGFS